MSNNPFATEEAWSAGGGFLGAGDHVVEVLEVDGSGRSSGGYPQIEITVGNADGQIRDWIVVIPSTIGKVVQLTDAAGIERPTDDEFEAEGEGYRLAEAYVGQLRAKKLGILVRAEPDFNDPTKTRDRIKGYVPASKIAKSDIPATHEPTTVGGHTFKSAVADPDDIPF